MVHRPQGEIDPVARAEIEKMKNENLKDVSLKEGIDWPILVGGVDAATLTTIVIPVFGHSPWGLAVTMVTVICSAFLLLNAKSTKAIKTKGKKA